MMGESSEHMSDRNVWSMIYKTFCFLYWVTVFWGVHKYEIRVSVSKCIVIFREAHGDTESHPRFVHDASSASNGYPFLFLLMIQNISYIIWMTWLVPKIFCLNIFQRQFFHMVLFQYFILTLENRSYPMTCHPILYVGK